MTKQALSQCELAAALCLRSSRLVVTVCTALVFTFVSCRDLNLPPIPGPVMPGTLSGRTVVATPGSPTRTALANARIEVLGSSLTAVSDADGFFTINGLTSSAGQVLFRADTDGDGRADRQKLLTLDSLKVGPGKQVTLGDVLLSENAVVRGQVLRKDLDTATGHAGTLVFVPIGPYTTTTSDDGSFVLNELPEGTLSLAFFRPGYEARGVDGLTLSSGQRFILEPVSITPQLTVAKPVDVSGRVLLADGTAAEGATITLTDSTTPHTATAGADGRFVVSAVPVGLYTLTAHRSGALDARFLNLLVNGSPIVLPDLVLGLLTSGSTGGGGGAIGGGTGTTGGGSGATGGGTGATGGGMSATGGGTSATGGGTSATGGGTSATGGGTGATGGGATGGGSATGGGTGSTGGGFISLPGAPTQVNAVLGPSSIAVSWVAPAASNPPVESYLLRTVPDGGTWLSVGASPYPVLLSSLVLGTTYTFGVSAVNDAGVGQEVFSAPVAYVTVPSAPTNVTALAGDSLASVSWQAPLNTGGRPLTAFVVTANPGGAQATVSGSATSATVSGLTNTTFYSFTVVAKNVVGDSLPSSASNSVVPQQGDTLSVTAGTAQTTSPNQYFPTTVDFIVKNLQGQPKGDAGITFTADNGAVASPSTFRTGANGIASVAVRAGRAPGFTTLVATLPGVAPQTVTLTVAPLDAGTIYPVTNADTKATNPISGLPGQGAAAAFFTWGLAAAPDGRLFAGTQNCQILMIQPDGTASIIAGTGTCGAMNGGSLPLSTALGNTKYIVYDGPRNRLYVKDIASNGPIHIVAVPLDSSVPVSLLVGGGPTGSPTYGDGLQGDQAQIPSDGEMVLSLDGQYLYFVDYVISRVRRYQFSTGLVTSALTGASNCNLAPNGTPSTFSQNLGIDSQGRLLTLGVVCGLGGNNLLLSKWSPGSSALVPLSGTTAGPSNGVQGRDLLMSSATYFTLDQADNIFFTDSQKLFRIDANTGLVTQVAGTGAFTISGNYGLSTLAAFDQPITRPTIDAAGTLSLASGTTIRSIVGAGQSQRTPLAIAKQGGDTQTGPLTGLLTQLQVVVTSASTSLSNVPVWWESLTSGSGVVAPGVVRSTSGLSVTQPRFGQQLGANAFRAGLRDFYGGDAGTVDFATTAVTPTAGLVSTLVNVDQANPSPTAGVPGPGVLAQLNNLNGIAVADGGVLYLGLSSSSFDLLRLDATGQLRSIRLPGATINGQTATPETALSLDEARQRLYFNLNASQIGMIDLTTGVEQPWAGGGSASGPGYGDGSTATAAVLGSFIRQSIAPDGSLFVFDYALSARIRVINPAGVINSWATQPVASLSAANCPNAPVLFTLIAENNLSSRNSFIQFDEAGNAYIAASYCGSSFPSNGLPALTGILQITPAGVITEWARINVAGVRASGLTRDSNGAIYWTEGSTPTNIYRIDPVTRQSAVVVGNGVRTTGPDFQPGKLTSVNPGYVVPLPGGRIGWVEAARSVRVLW